MRILYLCPELTAPSGGIKRLYYHVETLRKHGYDAWIVQQGTAQKPFWFETDIESVTLDTCMPFMPDDHIVVPDGLAGDSLAAALSHLQGCNVTLLVLNPYYLLQAEKNVPVLQLSEKLSIVSNSPTIASFLAWLYERRNIFTVKTGVDPALFYPEKKGDPIKIVYTLRKDTMSEMAIHLALRHLHKQGIPVETDVIAIENCSVEDYAQHLRQAHIWLTTALLHGFPRSTLEAMASGCLCLGFAGACGKDIIKVSDGNRTGNFIAANDGDLFSLAMELARVLKALRAGDAAMQDIVAAGIATAAKHTLEREEQSIVKLWQRLGS